MGTSKAYPTPSGGPWQKPKMEITRVLRNGGELDSPRGLVGSIVRANGGIGLGGSGAEGGSGGSSRRIGQAVSTLGTFAFTVAERGLGDALGVIGLAELDGLPALQVASAIAERIVESSDGLEAELLRTSLQEAILEAAQLSDDLDFNDLEQGLQVFLEENGVLGFVELFLAHYAYELVWMLIEQHANERLEDESTFAALSAAVEGVCHTQVSQALAEAAEGGGLQDVDWFGSDGQRIADEIAKAVAELLSQSS